MLDILLCMMMECRGGGKSMFTYKTYPHMHIYIKKQKYILCIYVELDTFNILCK